MVQGLNTKLEVCQKMLLSHVDVQGDNNNRPKGLSKLPTCHIDSGTTCRVYLVMGIWEFQNFARDSNARYIIAKSILTDEFLMSTQK